MNIPLLLFTIGITVGAYLLSRYLRQRYPHPLVNVVLISTILIILLFFMSGISYAQYQPGLHVMTFLLGPATVGLAVPLYRYRDLLVKSIVPVIIGIIAGSTAHLIVSVLLAKLLRLDKVIVLSLAPKSVTTPIAVGIAKIINGEPSLTAAFVIATGITGAVLTPVLLNLTKIHSPLARGLAYGTSAHGIGTAAAWLEGNIHGSMSGVAMGLAGIYTSIAAPFFVHWLVI